MDLPWLVVHGGWFGWVLLGACTLLLAIPLYRIGHRVVRRQQAEALERLGDAVSTDRLAAGRRVLAGRLRIDSALAATADERPACRGQLETDGGTIELDGPAMVVIGSHHDLKDNTVRTLRDGDAVHVKGELERLAGSETGYREASIAWRVSGSEDAPLQLVGAGPTRVAFSHGRLHASLLGALIAVMLTASISSAVVADHVRHGDGEIGLAELFAVTMPMTRGDTLEHLRYAAGREVFGKKQLDRYLALLVLDNCARGAEEMVHHGRFQAALELTDQCQEARGPRAAAHVALGQFEAASDIVDRHPAAAWSTDRGVIDIHLLAQRDDRALQFLKAQRHHLARKSLRGNPPQRLGDAMMAAQATCFAGALQSRIDDPHGIEVARNAHRDAIELFDRLTVGIPVVSEPAADMFEISAPDVERARRSLDVCPVAVVDLVSPETARGLFDLDELTYPSQRIATLAAVIAGDTDERLYDFGLRRFIWEDWITQSALLERASERLASASTEEAMARRLVVNLQLARWHEVAGDRARARALTDRAVNDERRLRVTGNIIARIQSDALAQRAVLARRDGDAVLVRRLFNEAVELRRALDNDDRHTWLVESQFKAALMEKETVRQELARHLWMSDGELSPAQLESQPLRRDSDFLARREWAALHGETAIAARYQRLLERRMAAEHNVTFQIFNTLVPHELQHVER